MSQRYPQKLDDALYAMVAAGHKAPAIRREIAAGRAGLPPLEIPLRTLQARIARLKKDRGEPVQTIPADVPIADAADAIARDYLAVARAQLTRFRDIAKVRPFTTPESLAFRNLTRVCDELGKSARARNPLPNGTGNHKGQGTGALLERLTDSKHSSNVEHVDYGNGTQPLDKGEAEPAPTQTPSLLSQAKDTSKDNADTEHSAQRRTAPEDGRQPVPVARANARLRAKLAGMESGTT